MRWFILSALAAVFLAVCVTTSSGSQPLEVASFEFDVTPPLGTPLCEGAVEKARRIDDPLKCRGIILMGAERPIVLCAVDWLGISGKGHKAWRQALADAAGTSPDRVAVNCLHQHDAPGFDPGAEDLMRQCKQPGQGYLLGFDQEVFARAARAVKSAPCPAKGGHTRGHWKSRGQKSGFLPPRPGPGRQGSPHPLERNSRPRCPRRPRGHH